jgi:hypothetical protein
MLLLAHLFGRIMMGYEKRVKDKVMVGFRKGDTRTWHVGEERMRETGCIGDGHSSGLGLLIASRHGGAAFRAVERASVRDAVVHFLPV